MRVRSMLVTCAASLFALVSVPASAASFTLEQWDLGVSVDLFPGTERDVDGTSQLQTPLQTTHFATVPPSWASATYDIEYSQTSGRFLIESSQNALGGPFGTSVHTQASGSFIFTVDAPIAITLDAAFDYDLPPVSMGVFLSFRLLDVDDPETVLFGAGAADNAFTGEGASGTLAFADAAVLPGGHTYGIMYIMRISTGGGPITAFGTGDGYIDFTLQVVPEPATALLLICALPLMRHWRRR